MDLTRRVHSSFAQFEHLRQNTGARSRGGFLIAAKIENTSIDHDDVSIVGTQYISHHFALLERELGTKSKITKLTFFTLTKTKTRT